MQTLNQLIATYISIADRHEQINGFFLGPDSLIDAEEDLLYPLLVVNPISATMPKTNNGFNVFGLTFEVKILDQPRKNDQDTNIEILSDGVQILNDIMTEFSNHPFYFDNEINITNDLAIDKIEFDYENDLSGWVVPVNIETPNRNTFCGAPISSIPDYTIDIPSVTVIDGETTLTLFYGDSYTCSGGIVPSGIAYCYPALTGQTTSYATGDDADNAINNPYPANPANPTHTTRLVDFDTLAANNHFGTTVRITNSLGLTASYDGSGGEVANYAIDHFTGIGHYLVIPSNVTWATAISDANSSTAAGFSDWFVGNAQQVTVICSRELTRSLDYAPFNNSSTSFWTSTTSKTATSNKLFYRNDRGTVERVAGTAITSYLLMRIHIFS